MGEGRLAGAGDAGEADEKAEREVGVEFLQVVAGRAVDFDLGFGGLAALLRDGDGAGAVEPRQSAGDGRWWMGDGRWKTFGGSLAFLWHVELLTWNFALKDQRPAVLAGPGADVDELVGGAHDGFLVLDDDQGVALVAEAVHHADEALDVAGVEADGGFVEDEQGVC